MKSSIIVILSLAISACALQAELPVENRVFIESIATPLGRTLAEVRRLQEDSPTMLRMEVAYSGLGRVNFEGNPNRVMAKSALEALADCHRSMRKLREIDSRVPDFENLADQLLVAAPGLYKTYNKEDLTASDRDSVNKLMASAALEGLALMWNAWSASDERDSYKAKYRKVRELGKSSQFFQSIQGPAVRPILGGVLAMEIQGSWCNTFSEDVVEFTNVSGKILRNVVMRVSILGYHGSGAHLPKADLNSECHLHFVEVWQPGEHRFARYAARNGSGIVDDESLDIIDGIKVDIISDELRSVDEKKYSGPNFDADVKRWFKEANPRFRGGWSTFQEGLIFDEDANISLNCESKFSSLPISGARARLMKKGKVVDEFGLSLSGGRLEMGRMTGGASWRLPRLNYLRSGDVDALELTLIFSRSDYEETIVWEY